MWVLVAGGVLIICPVINRWQVPIVLAFTFNAVVYLRVSAAFRKLGAQGTVEARKERLVQLRLRL